MIRSYVHCFDIHIYKLLLLRLCGIEMRYGKKLAGSALGLYTSVRRNNFSRRLNRQGAETSAWNFGK